MPYVTSIERNAEERGRSQERLSLLLRLLARKCAPLPDSVRGQVQALSSEQCESLFETSLGFQSLDNLQEWLRFNSAP